MTDLEKLLSDFNSQVFAIKDKKSLEEIRISFLGKKGLVTELFSQLKNLAAEEKKSFGAGINQLRDQITKQLDDKKDEFEIAELNEKLSDEKIDLTEPVRKKSIGLIHPVSKVMREIEEIFSQFGFEFAQGPEIEDDFHNFTALNIDETHPARQMQDTFYLKNSELLLRTHTSNVQIRKMQNSKPPFRIAALGRVFRCDSDQTHAPMFHQFEGFVVDENITMGHLKWTLENFLQKFFGDRNLELRFRPSFFPFTEPSAEVDINYTIEQEKIKIGNGDKFMEILGCGMIHPNVLRNCGIDDEKFQGFAFGIGIERLAMLKYGIADLRMFFENDVRFLNHFGFRNCL
ncbi:MAG: phenylalanine--tRNA ligase subunit alpha [Alphaproteobacteria bacterium RIFCSPLOWO2_01_FULL_40_26]|nr:MAG: phenylalanine--tRNA ligase subunit alpha [Alphaproteobacteria bacterium RIFCSPLOWO2_01_FULL_40_26]OFX10108.1 MAG: phenylalanine--tRNA ligase subunit alpha [Alphaproteobacteria bacterium RIFCSPLOWO2_02_FULL_40_19]